MSEVHGEGYDIVYSDVCLRYMGKDMILYSVMCV